MIMSPDSIIMNKVVEIITSSNSGVTNILFAIIPTLPAIAAMVTIKKCIENSGDVFSSISTYIGCIFKRLFYTTRLLDNCDRADSQDYFFKKSVEKKTYFFNSFMFPIYWNYEPEHKIGILSHMKWFYGHKEYVNECEKEADTEREVYNCIKQQKKTIYKKLATTEGLPKYCVSISSKLYPSRNYVNLVKIIKTHVSVAKIVESYNVLGILIDGIPGLGKTKFADFAVEEKLVGHVYKVDMTTMLKYAFSETLQLMYHKIDIITDTIFVIDEIDKYIDYRVDLEYNHDCDKQKRKQTSDKDDKHHIINRTFEEFRTQAKTTFLYDMLSILERDGLGYSVVVLFCSNNFCSVFEGVNLTHHKSLYDRFMKVHFDECDHAEIIEYILHYNGRFIKTEYFRELNVEEIKNSLRKDISVTHRTLHHISVACKYDAFEIIKMLNSHVKEDDSGEDLKSKVEKYSNKKKIIKNMIKHDESSEDEIVLENSEEKESVFTIESDESDEEKGTIFIVESDEENELPEHKKLWMEKYSAIHSSPEEKNQIIKTIGKYLNVSKKINDDEDSPYNMDSSSGAELFDYMATDGYKIMNTHPKFKETVLEKIDDFRSTQPQLFMLLKPETKDFIYAFSGMKC